MNRTPVMIFAAGRGTRMGALTQTRPKPLIEVAGRPLIDHALDLAGDRPVVVNLHHLGDMLRAHLARRAIAFSDESDRLLETGGGLRKARPLLGTSPVFTLNSDAVWQGPNPLDLLAEGWRDGMEALLLLLPRDRALGHRGTGDFLPGPDGRLERGPGLVYSGAQLLRTEGLDEIDEAVFSLNRLWDRAMSRGGLFGLVYPGAWCDVGQPESIPLAENLIGWADVR